MIVRIRKDGDQWLAYFLEIRRLIGINQTGADILDWYFNREEDKETISEKLAQIHRISLEQAKQDVADFLSDIRDELRPDKFNDTEQVNMNIPLGVELEVTSSCNLRCRHCLQSDYSPVFMSLDKARWIIGTVSKSHIFEISLIGGEPLMHPQICEIMECASKENLAVGLTTNGTLIDNHHIKVMEKMENLSVAVSIDGGEYDHDYIRGKGSFNKSDRAIHAMINVGIEVEVLFTITSYNIERYMPVLEYCKKLGIACNFNLFKPFKRNHSLLVPDPAKFFSLIMTLFELRRSGDFAIGLSNAALTGCLMGLPDRNECRAGQAGLVIDVHSRMLTCPSLLYCGCYSENDFPEFNGSFMETWKNHPLFTRFREDGLSGCQARSFIYSGDVRKGDPYDLVAFKRFLGRQV